MRLELNQLVPKCTWREDGEKSKEEDAKKDEDAVEGFYTGKSSIFSRLLLTSKNEFF